MSIFERFNRFKKTITLPDGTSEKAVYTRLGRSNTSNFRMNFVYTLLVSDNTRLENGMLFTADIYGKVRKFLAVSVRHTEGSVQLIAYECNCSVEIYRPTTLYDKYDNEIGSEVTLVDTTSANYVTINASMRTLDAGLLPATTKEFRMPKCNIQELDRIVLNDENYCVDAIDQTKFFGMLAVQVSLDERSL